MPLRVASNCRASGDAARRSASGVSGGTRPFGGSNRSDVRPSSVRLSP